MSTADLALTLATYRHAHDFTHNYAFCYKDGRYMYAAFIPNLTISEMLELAVLDRSVAKHSDRGAVLRYKGRATATRRLVARRGIRPVCLGSAELYAAEVKAFKKATGLNAGDFFEKVIANLYGLEWNGHNSDDARTAGDLIIDGVAWQLKANYGNFANEKQLLSW